MCTLSFFPWHFNKCDNYFIQLFYTIVLNLLASAPRRTLIATWYSNTKIQAHAHTQHTTHTGAPQVTFKPFYVKNPFMQNSPFLPKNPTFITKNPFWGGQKGYQKSHDITLHSKIIKLWKPKDLSIFIYFKKKAYYFSSRRDLHEYAFILWKWRCWKKP